MLYYRYSNEKNHKLIEERGFSFEDIIYHIENGGLVDIIENKNDDRYSHQQVFVVKMKEYIHLVPFVHEDEETIFLKTAFKDRKANEFYQAGKRDG